MPPKERITEEYYEFWICNCDDRKIITGILAENGYTVTTARKLIGANYHDFIIVYKKEANMGEDL
jgi:hypothetical protein